MPHHRASHALCGQQMLGPPGPAPLPQGCSVKGSANAPQWPRAGKRSAWAVPGPGDVQRRWLSEGVPATRDLLAGLWTVRACWQAKESERGVAWPLSREAAGVGPRGCPGRTATFSSQGMALWGSRSRVSQVHQSWPGRPLLLGILSSACQRSSPARAALPVSQPCQNHQLPISLVFTVPQAPGSCRPQIPPSLPAKP